MELFDFWVPITYLCILTETYLLRYTRVSFCSCWTRNDVKLYAGAYHSTYTAIFLIQHATLMGINVHFLVDVEFVCWPSSCATPKLQFDVVIFVFLC